MAHGKPKKQGNKMSNNDVAMLLFMIAVLSVLAQIFPSPQPAGSAGKDAKKVASALVDGLDSEEVVVADGDTLQLQGRESEPVRLLQINAPESEQCYGDPATKRLREMVSRADDLKLRYDSKLKKDRFERTLAYLYDGKRNLNIRLVREGYAVPYYIGGERGEHAQRIQRASDRARSERRGLWGSCAPENRPPSK